MYNVPPHKVHIMRTYTLICTLLREKRRGTKREGKATKELCASCCWCNCAVAKKGILHWIKPDCTRDSEATHL